MEEGTGVEGEGRGVGKEGREGRGVRKERREGEERGGEGKGGKGKGGRGEGKGRERGGRKGKEDGGRVEEAGEGAGAYCQICCMTHMHACTYMYLPLQRLHPCHNHH